MCITVGSFGICQVDSVTRQDKKFITRKANFPKSARLLKSDEFSSVFRFRPLYHSTHFLIYRKKTGLEARLGLVISRRYAPRAVTRNFIKRRVREAFRIRRAEFNGWDILFRLHRKFDEKIAQSASSMQLSLISSSEIYKLLDCVSQEVIGLNKEKF